MACKVYSCSIFARLLNAEPPVRKMSSACRDLVQSLDATGEQSRAEPQVRFCLQAVMALLDAPATPAAEKNEVLVDLLDADLPVKILQAMPQLEFEAGKDSMRLFSQILKIGSQHVLDYICSHGQLLQMLISGCSNFGVALQSNMMIRAGTKHSELVEIFFQAGFAPGLINLVKDPNFEISSDAFHSLRELLMACKPVSASYIIVNFEQFFSAYHSLLQMDDYFKKRQALCLLADILLDNEFADVAAKYMCEDEFLKIHMNFLRDSSKALQSDAFRMFSIFVFNPQASARVHRILFKNRERLAILLKTMRSDCVKSDDHLVQSLKEAAQCLESLPVPPLRSRTVSEASNSSGRMLEQTEMQDFDYAPVIALNQWHTIF